MKWSVSFPQKLILFLQSVVPQESGKSLRRALASNLCRVNGKVERFASTQLRKGDVVELISSWKQVIATPRLEFKTLYEDDSILLVDKPAGWVCDPQSCGRTFGKDCFLVHRLDKDTTGVLAIAKSPKMRDHLMDQFATRLVEKKYLALADGIFNQKQGIRDTLLTKKKSYEGQTIWGSSTNGLQAITQWRVVAEGKLASLVLCSPLTGRTHQIRVHLAELGHPILIDRQYASHYRSPLFTKRVLLHAFHLRFQFEEKIIEARAPIPEDMKEALRFCGISDTIQKSIEP